MTDSSDETLICPQCSHASLARTVADPPLCPACGTALRQSDPAPGRSNPDLSLGAPELDEDELTPDLARPAAPPSKPGRLAALSTTVFSSLGGARRGQDSQGSATGQGRSGGWLLTALVLPLVVLVVWRIWLPPSFSPPPPVTSAKAPPAQLAAVSPNSPETSQKSEHQAPVSSSRLPWTKIPLSPPDPRLTLAEQWQADRERVRMLETEQLRDALRIPTESEDNRTMLIARSRRMSEERDQRLERIDQQACEVFRQNPDHVDAAEMSFKKFEAEGDYVQAIRACDLLRNVLTPPTPDRADLLHEVLASYRNCEPNIPYGQNPIWRDEVEARARDAALPSDRALPQVKVALESGSFVIELFEEDVPNAVANFVSLTEKGFYNGKWFVKHPTRRLFHGGKTDPTRDTENHAGHRIPWEQSRRNSHETFDGHVAMVTTIDHSGASSLFQIVDGDERFDDQGALLIGRVVEGMEVVRAIVKNEKMTASVIRKRPHRYTARVLPLERGPPESEAPIRMRSPARPPESERWLADWNRLLTLEAERTNVEMNLRVAKAEDRERWIAKLHSVSDQRDQLTEQVHSEAPAVFRLDRNNIQAARLSFRRLFDEGDFVEAIRACDAVRDTYLLWSQLKQKENVINIMKACRRKIAWEQDPVWQEELAAREREDALPPDQALPRVKISLERGFFVVELFEDETPNTVANFISLVEKGFYDGKQFLGAAGPYALISCDNAEEPENLGNAGYRIPFEHAGRRTRHNYEGTIGMNVSGKDFTGSSVFYVSMDAHPSFDARGLPFGRVVEGMEVVRAIQKSDKMTATVIRKRNHRYVPRTLPL